MISKAWSSADRGRGRGADCRRGPCRDRSVRGTLRRSSAPRSCSLTHAIRSAETASWSYRLRPVPLARIVLPTAGSRGSHKPIPYPVSPWSTQPRRCPSEPVEDAERGAPEGIGGRRWKSGSIIDRNDAQCSPVFRVGDTAGCGTAESKAFSPPPLRPPARAPMSAPIDPGPVGSADQVGRRP